MRLGYIHYDQKPNGVVYASLYESFRDKGKVRTRRVENLGKVIDKENNIFCQKGAIYQYVLGEGRRDVPPSALPSEPVVPEAERMILDFGDAWFLQEYLSGQPFYDSIRNTLPNKSDTLLALIFYRLLTNKGAACHARIWYEGNYSYLAFPRADLTGQNISRVLKDFALKSINIDCIYITIFHNPLHNPDTDFRRLQSFRFHRNCRFPCLVSRADSNQRPSMIGGIGSGAKAIFGIGNRRAKSLQRAGS